VCPHETLGGRKVSTEGGKTNNYSVKVQYHKCPHRSLVRDRIFILEVNLAGYVFLGGEVGTDMITLLAACIVVYWILDLS
jgi:hypothetical protein